MPTYEYICEKCERTFEIVQPISEPPLTVCPKDQCGQKRWGKGRVRRAISAGGGLIFKGSGFYITDYRSDSYKQAAKNETAGGEAKPAPAKSESPAAAKPESKPAKPAGQKE